MSYPKRKAIYDGRGAWFWLALGLVGLASPAAAPHLLATPDFAGLYRPVPDRLLPATRREGDSLRIFINQPVAAPGSAPMRLRLTGWATYEAKQPLWQVLRLARPYPGSTPTAPVQVLTAAVAASQLAPGAVLQVSLDKPALTNQPPSSDQDPSTTAWLRLTPEVLARPFVLLDSAGLVLARPYVNAGESVAVATFGLTQPVRWRRYPTGTPALPPFTDPRSQVAAPRTLGVLDSSAAPVAAGNLLRLPEQGLYALKVGGAGGEPVRTLPLLVVPASFPGQSTAPEVIAPLLYLTTTAERQALLKAPDPKRAIDRFWLDAAGGDQMRGRDMIRRYYQRVTTANEVFTGHKAGWLTDRGLLYVVLGPPQSVRRLPTGEERWHYDQAGRQGEAVAFTFRPRPSTLAPNNYELVRRPEYELLWYAAVEQWRRTTTAR
ncbi:GWxTD domain-containing protein [Hymenobacter sp. BRD128]|uniref:GWxTD domain-containing protein n=1 Tax=Hymenobacter sp. BRD128 TaxID=2675878 RepID=UPI0015637B0D|nr:GWxTD domain-containing protein [Hymenobacter sp. BRD128]QKG57617.1 GWxTD domain-containing protein [Hymenobacter sp. BRD128]